MGRRLNVSILAALFAGGCIVLFATLFFIVSRSFGAAIAELVEADTRVTLIDADGSVAYDTDDVRESHATREEVVQAFARGTGTSLRHSQTLDRDFLYCARKVGDRVVRLAFPYTGVLKSERLAWGGLVLAGVLGAGVVWLVFLVARRLSRRIEEQSRRLEIASATERFRREFTSNVSHELKSPLTSILGAVEMLADRTRLSAEEERDLFAILTHECERLNGLVGDILSLSQMEREATGAKRAFETLSLSDLVAACVAHERAKAHAVHVELALAGNDAATVRGDAMRLEEALQNLIANALRYSGSDRVEVAVRARADKAFVSVTDFGIGIGKEHIPHLFERFYRVSKSRSRTLGGTGLGLAIVKHIVQLHGGDVFVSSTPGVKTCFGFWLPLVSTNNKKGES